MINFPCHGEKYQRATDANSLTAADRDERVAGEAYRGIERRAFLCLLAIATITALSLVSCGSVKSQSNVRSQSITYAVISGEF